MTGRHRARHGRAVAAPRDGVFDLVADVTRWPVLFGPTVHVEHLERGPSHERFRIWALVNDAVASWSSRRELDRPAGRIGFRQEHSSPPLTTMGGSWEMADRPGGGTEVVLHHDFAVEGDDAGTVAHIEEALDRNSEQELAALARAAEAGAVAGELFLAFEDVVSLPVPPADAYAFVDGAQEWPARLGHVAAVALDEEAPGVQRLEMETTTPDGRSHVTRSVRLCFPGPDGGDGGRIVYKQQVPPRLLWGHSGSWAFAADGPGTVVTARHQVLIDPSAIEGACGAGATPADARRQVRAALGANSRATLAAAGAAGVRRAGP